MANKRNILPNNENKSEVQELPRSVQRKGKSQTGHVPEDKMEVSNKNAKVTRSGGGKLTVKEVAAASMNKKKI